MHLLGLRMSSVKQPAKGAERRSSVRTRCFRMARCVFNGRTELEERCPEHSTTGVRIVCDELISLPDQFELHLHDGYGRFEARKVRRAWSRGFTAGLHFLDAGAPRVRPAAISAFRDGANSSSP